MMETYEDIRASVRVLAAGSRGPGPGAYAVLRAAIAAPK